MSHWVASRHEPFVDPPPLLRLIPFLLADPPPGADPQSILPSAAGTPQLLGMVLPVMSVMLSITVGLCGGLLLSTMLRPHSLLAAVLPSMAPSTTFR